MVTRATRVGKLRPLTRNESARIAVLARLSTEDWAEITRPANESPNHVQNLERWRRIARESNPHLTDTQVERLAVRLRSEHHAEMGRRSGAARRGEVA